MPKIRYQGFNFKATTLARIEQANGIIQEYAEQGFDLTLRQIFYQFVSRALIANNDREYKKLGSIIADARLAGLIDWDAIADRTRYIRKLAVWENPQAIVEACAQQFRVDKWARQEAYAEVLIEKDALVGVIEGVCNELEVPYLSCRGYPSASEIWRGGHQRLRPRLKAGKRCVIYYLGDHDPSGIDVTRDVRDRLNLFSAGPCEVEVVRLALNMDQVEQYSPPPNPTKSSDSRTPWYVDQFGESCWELDAMAPPVIAALIRTAVMELRDEDLWQEAVTEEDEHKRHLQAVANHWDEVIERLSPDDEEQ